MTKTILISALTLLSFTASSKEYPMRCLENPQEWSAHYANPTQTIDKKARQNLTQWTPKVTALWQELETVLAGADFQGQGMAAASFQAWADKQDKLLRAVQQSLRKFSYTGTDYEVCTQALTYGITFQKDYARALAVYHDPAHPEVQQAAADLQKYLQHLPQ